ncbi:hypothetical protein E0Z10_g3036 [Xylaria hypoxylon]|uniref:Phospho-2-dehydro-3-deoxyheptonate aldolase n=1 Tax=Xylaria hypoxylon TaxID=37992 RepID=A0A4Z0YPL9_9PEZI|nr:hypothetical protein E0Z10_g3036 [Xylaria hypoxylon]
MHRNIARTSLVPAEVISALPLDQNTLNHVDSGRSAVKQLLEYPRSNGRLLVIIGPCSIHHLDAALDYATRLAAAAARHQDQLLIAMRVYIEKPRTTVGWKGLVHDPDLTQADNSDIARGILVSRGIMLSVVKMGLPIATEILSPLLMPFIHDLLTVGVIGARTTESQTHRELSSDVTFPVGFKNNTEGSLKSAIDAMTAAAQPHTMLGIDEHGCLVHRLSSGNLDTFAVLRGGSSGPNYSRKHVGQAEMALVKSGMQSRIVIDCSHGNSSKDYRNQGRVAAAVAEQIAAGSGILGVMIESNINPGRQDIPPCGSSGLAYGVSITDGCVGWDETEAILDMLSAAVKQRQTDQKVTNSVPALASEPSSRNMTLVQKNDIVITTKALSGSLGSIS